MVPPRDGLVALLLLGSRKQCLPQRSGCPWPRLMGTPGTSGVTCVQCEGGGGGGAGQRAEEWGIWASPTRKRGEARGGRPDGGGARAAKTVKRPPQHPAHPQYANYWAPLTRNRHAMPHPAQSQHTNHWAPRPRKRHQQEHRPQRPTDRSDPTQHAKGRTGDCPGPRKETATRRNVTRGADDVCCVYGRGGIHCICLRRTPSAPQTAASSALCWGLGGPVVPEGKERGGGIAATVPQRLIVRWLNHRHSGSEATGNDVLE